MSDGDTGTPRLLGHDYWLVVSSPVGGMDPDRFEQVLPDHLRRVSRLEAEGTVFLAGPLLSGPGVSRGSGVIVLRADGEDSARAIHDRDPLHEAGLRTFAVNRWRLNEGSVSVRLFLGAGTLDRG